MSCAVALKLGGRFLDAMFAVLCKVIALEKSLMIVISNAFVFSTCLLVVVFRYGYDPRQDSNKYITILLIQSLFFQNVINEYILYTFNVVISD